MDLIALYVVVSLLTVAVIAAAGIRLKVVQDREMFWAIIQQAVTTRRDAVVGVIALVIYSVVYLVLGNHVHLFYGRLIFTVTPGVVLVLIVSALLVGILFALFSYNLRTLGLTQGKKGTWGVVGSLLAVAVSFCP
jgi:CBS domain containing-hemolysin-like protein